MVPQMREDMTLVKAGNDAILPTLSPQEDGTGRATLVVFPGFLVRLNTRISCFYV